MYAKEKEIIRKTIESNEFENYKNACIIEGAFGKYNIVSSCNAEGLIQFVDRQRNMSRHVKVNVLKYVDVNGKNCPYEVEEAYIMPESIYLLKDYKDFKGVNEELKSTLEVIENIESITVL